MKKTGQTFLLLVLSLCFMMTVATALIGEQLYTEKFCITCHGQKGISIAPNYPNLAGQNEQYIANQVTDILSGKRKNKLTLLMTENPVVKKITVEEIAGIASYMKNIK